MNKINIGVEIAFRHKYGDHTETGYVNDIKRFMFWKIYLVEDEYFDYHIITAGGCYIMPTGYKRACGGKKNEQ